MIIKYLKIQNHLMIFNYRLNKYNKNLKMFYKLMEIIKVLFLYKFKVIV